MTKAANDFDLKTAYENILIALRKESEDPMIGVTILEFCKHFLIESMCDD